MNSPTTSAVVDLKRERGALNALALTGDVQAQKRIAAIEADLNELAAVDERRVDEVAHNVEAARALSAAEERERLRRQNERVRGLLDKKRELASRIDVAAPELADLWTGYMGCISSLWAIRKSLGLTDRGIHRNDTDHAKYRLGQWLSGRFWMAYRLDPKRYLQDTNHSGLPDLADSECTDLDDDLIVEVPDEKETT